jgi:F0F1-type ATP synthase membrane subunit b/b'
MDLLWRKVSEKEKEEIRKQAKRIIDNFSKKLEKIKEEIKDKKKNPKNPGREEGGAQINIDREIMFENAPMRNKDFLIAEKGEW